MENAIVEKIRKLLALASNNSNVHEAANAAARAQELMLQHKIEMADVEIAGGEVTPEAVGEETLEGGDKRKATNWRSGLAHVLSAAFNAKTYTCNGSNKIQIIGRPSDVQTVRYLMGYLAGEIERLCERDWSDLLAQYKAGEYDDLAPPNAKAWRSSFKLGAVNEINARLKKTKAENEAKVQAAKGAALVLVRKHDELAQAQVTAAAKAHGLVSRASARISAPNAYVAGKAAAREIDMDNNRRGLGASKQRLAG